MKKITLQQVIDNMVYGATVGFGGTVGYKLALMAWSAVF